MTLIPCSESCIHQSEGYCRLEGAAPVTNSDSDGCIHRQSPTGISVDAGACSH